MVRQEYHDLLLAILASLKRRQLGNLERTQDVANDAMDVGGWVVKIEDNEETALTRPFDLRVDGQVDLSNLADYPNPFLETPYSGLYEERNSIIVTGLPGIGKTLFLNMLFHLRVAANFPTLYMSTPASATVFRNGYLGELTSMTPLAVRSNLTKDTWCLIDSNVGFDAVPGVLTDTKCFIIQASSPRPARMKWLKKRPGMGQFCLMKPWTIEELYFASSLQHDNWIWNEERIKSFYERFGGSARHAFKDIQDPVAFEESINLAAACLNPDKIQNYIRSDPDNLSIPDDATHMLLSAFPLNNLDRSMWQIKSPSAAMEMILFKRLDEELKQARRKMYQICVGVKSPGYRATAACLLDQQYHTILIKGGCWPVTSFKKLATPKGGSTTIGWVAQTDPSGFLQSHSGIRLVAAGNTILPSVSTPSEYVELDQEHEAIQLEQLRLGVYYRPLRTTLITFDSFYIDAADHAIVFQTSLKKRRDMKETGITWLQQHGVQKFTYVYVTPIHSETTIAVSVKHEAFF